MCIYIYIHVHICAYTYTYIYIYTCIRTTRICICAYVRTYIHRCTRTYTYIHIYIHTYIHTCIHTYAHVYVHIYPASCKYPAPPNRTPIALGKLQGASSGSETPRCLATWTCPKQLLGLKYGVCRVSVLGIVIMVWGRDLLFEYLDARVALLGGPGYLLLISQSQPNQLYLGAS